jgi:hypothetical protein
MAEALRMLVLGCRARGFIRVISGRIVSLIRVLGLEGEGICSSRVEGVRYHLEVDGETDQSR